MCESLSLCLWTLFYMIALCAIYASSRAFFASWQPLARASFQICTLYENPREIIGP